LRFLWGGGVVVSMVSRIIPVLTVGMVPSSIIPTSGLCQTYSKELSEDDIDNLKAVGRNKEHIIKGVFGSSILNVNEKRLKEDIGLKESDFVVMLVGTRIGIEADKSFWEMLDRCQVNNLKVIIIGCELEEVRSKIVEYSIRDKVHGLGMTSDPLGFMSAADLYVNPIRRGGGTSAVEAMSLGIPVVTTNYGDVAVNVGEDFTVNSYDEMIQEIEKYAVDTDYYRSKADKAKKRAATLLNAEDAFVDIVAEFARRNNIKL